MAVKKYYELSRKEAHRYRKTLISQLKKNGFQDDDILLIVDGLSGLSPGGKEKAARELSALLAGSAQPEEVTAWIDRFRVPQYQYPID